MVALIVETPSRVQVPPLTHPQICTVGVKRVEAPLVSLAMNVSGSYVTCSGVQRKTYSFSFVASKVASSGKPFSRLKVKLSLESVTSRVRVEVWPIVTSMIDLAEMLGGKLPACIVITYEVISISFMGYESVPYNVSHNQDLLLAINY